MSKKRRASSPATHEVEPAEERHTGLDAPDAEETDAEETDADRSDDAGTAGDHRVRDDGGGAVPDRLDGPVNETDPAAAAAHDAPASDDGLLSRLAVIAAQPLPERADALAQLHDELRSRLEAGDSPRDRA